MKMPRDTLQSYYTDEPIYFWEAEGPSTELPRSRHGISEAGSRELKIEEASLTNFRKFLLSIRTIYLVNSTGNIGIVHNLSSLYLWGGPLSGCGKFHVELVEVGRELLVKSSIDPFDGERTSGNHAPNTKFNRKEHWRQVFTEPIVATSIFINDRMSYDM